MASILCVHGIGQQLKGEEILANEWRAALRDGMRIAGVQPKDLPIDENIAVTFYGDLFREETVKGLDAPFRLSDIDEGFEADLVRAWLKEAEASAAQANMIHVATPFKSGWQRETVQRLAVALLRYPFFASMTERLFVGALKQVRTYFTESTRRQTVRQRFVAQLRAETKLVIAHSLGSIVAYEGLNEAEGCIAPSFITLGSPLGLPNLIFDRLIPAPVCGKGVWPGNVRSWVNIADSHDIVAAVKNLSPLFGGVRDVRVANEAQAHDVSPYLTARETGVAVSEALYG